MNDFISRFSILIGNNGKTDLPFTIGGVTQDGENKSDGGHNNQDAASILTENNLMIAVVCDGCAGPSPLGMNTSSYNEVGAGVLSIIVLRAVKVLIEEGVEVPVLAEKLENVLTTNLGDLLSLIGGKETNLRQHILMDMLSATILVAVVTDKFWCLLNCGDGLVGYNGIMVNLDKYSGTYFANKLSPITEEQEHFFQLAASGSTDELQSLLVATDGVLDFTSGSNYSLLQMLNTLDKREYIPGFDGKMRFVREFRKRVSQQKENANILHHPHDDRTLVMIRRLSSRDATVIDSLVKDVESEVQKHEDKAMSRDQAAVEKSNKKVEIQESLAETERSSKVNSNNKEVMKLMSDTSFCMRESPETKAFIEDKPKPFSKSKKSLQENEENIAENISTNDTITEDIKKYEKSSVNLESKLQKKARSRRCSHD